MHDLSQPGTRPADLPGDPTGWPTAPGAVIGHRKDGRPIRLLAGGAPDDGADDTGSDDGGEGGQDDGRDGGGGDGGRDDDPDDGAEDDDTGSGSGRDGEPGKGRAKRRNRDATRDAIRDGGRDGGRNNDDDPDDEGVDSRARKVIDRVRGEFKDERARRQAAEKQIADAQAAAAAAQKTVEEIRAQQAERDEQLAKLLGLKEDDTPPDPAKLAEQLTAAQQAAEKADAEREAAIADRDEQLRLARIENAVLVTAPDLDADPKALADSKRFAKSIADLDPDADDFTEQVEAAITKAIKDDSRLKRAKPAERSGGGDFGGQRKPRQRPTSIAEAVSRAYSKT